MNKRLALFLFIISFTITLACVAMAMSAKPAQQAKAPPEKIQPDIDPFVYADFMEAKTFFGVMPHRRGNGEAASTGNSSWFIFEYFDENDQLIGRKRLSHYHPLMTDIEETHVTWTDAQGQVIYED